MNSHGSGFCNALPNTQGEHHNRSGSLKELLFGTMWSEMYLSSRNQTDEHRAPTQPFQSRCPLYPSRPGALAAASGGGYSAPNRRGCWGCKSNDSDPFCCSGRGRCAVGVCLCNPGAFGIDCAHSKVKVGSSRAESSEPPPRSGDGGGAPSGGVRIYVHDMPIIDQVRLGLVAYGSLRKHLLGSDVLASIMRSAFGIARDDNYSYNLYKIVNFVRGDDPIYSAEIRFLHQLLEDGATRTTDPFQADLFFVPTFGYHLGGGNLVAPIGAVEEAVAHLQRTMPFFWNRHEGRDHIFFSTADVGWCGGCSLKENNRSKGKWRKPVMHRFGFPAKKQPCERAALARQNSILMSHWGLLGSSSMMEADAALAGSAHELEEAMRDGPGDGGKRGAWCYAPHKDVVVPPFVKAHDPSPPHSPRTPRGPSPAHCGWSCRKLKAKYPVKVPPPPPSPPLPPPSPSSSPRADQGWDHELVFAGGIWGWMNRGAHAVTRYSLGMRQQLWLRYGSEAAGAATGILISNRSIPSSLWRQAKFCLAPAGNGWGIRISISAILNCVPLVAQPNVVQGFEDVLPFEAFSKTIGHGDIVALAQILRRVSAAEIAAKRRALEAVRGAFLWLDGSDDGTPGLAYNYTLLALCHRAMELHGRLRAGPRASCDRLAAGLPLASRRRRFPSWFPPELRNATQRLIRERRSASEGREPPRPR